MNQNKTRSEKEHSHAKILQNPLPSFIDETHGK
jgi:hypothetical protein